MQEKLNLLFGSIDGKTKEDSSQGAYETVEEGLTTDTTDIGTDREEGSTSQTIRAKQQLA